MTLYTSRKEIPVKDTWDLSSLYKSDEEFLKRLKELEEEIPLVSKYRGRLFQEDHFLKETVETSMKILEEFYNLAVYAHLRKDEDTRISTYVDYENKVQALGVILSQEMAYFEPEVLSKEESYVKELVEKTMPLYGHYFEQILRSKPHILSEAEEKILSGVAEVLSGPSRIFSTLNNADLRFGNVINEEGKEVELTHGNYVLFMESKNREVRKSAFKAMYAKYQEHNHTLASILHHQVKKNVNLAKLRKHSGARACALFPNNIPESLYDGLIEEVHRALPSMYKYMELRKKALGVEELHMYDVYVPLEEAADTTITYEQAKELVKEGLKPLGTEYASLLDKAFTQRWIDVYETPGKRSGAYSSGTYGSYPYILLNHQEDLNSAFTLAHELGHSMHSYFTHTSQPFVYGDYSIFLAEIASTFNEAFLQDYLLSKEKDPAKRRYYINRFLDTIKGTIFRQTMFAEFEREIHAHVEAGGTLSPDYLNEVYLNTNKKYFGESVVSDEEIQYEWSRIPHFYYQFYVYQYATGLSSALSLFKRVKEKQEGALEGYFEFLKAGSTAYPLDVLSKAGVDMSDGRSVREALEVFASLVDLLEKEMEQNS